MRTNELMLYKNMEYGEILKDITFLIDNYESEFYNKEDLRGLLFDCINELLELSVSHGFEGNLWHTYLTFLLASDENAYSTSCEIVGEIEGSLNEIALHDFAIFKEMFDYDFEELEKSLDADCLKIIMDIRVVTVVVKCSTVVSGTESVISAVPLPRRRTWSISSVH